MHRALGLDVLARPRCGGRLGVLANRPGPAVVRTILAHRGLTPDPDGPGLMIDGINSTALRQGQFKYQSTIE